MGFFGSKGEKKERGLPRHIRVRRGTADDELPTFEVMRRTMNMEMSWTNHAPTRHHLRKSPDVSFWLAEETSLFGAPKVVGYARSMVREGVWCLNEFFLLPGHQRQGIGGTLLAACLKDGDAAGADGHLVLASHHPSADSLYIRRAGCFPRLPMMLLVGSLLNLRLPEAEAATILDTVLPPSALAPGTAHETLYAEPIVLTPETQAAFDALDREIVGYARPTEHVFWAERMGGQERPSRLFRRVGASGEKGEIVGYAYLGNEITGPVLARTSADLPRLIHHIVTVSQRLPAPANPFEFRPLELYFPICGSNEIMLTWLLGCGWHIAFQYLFMSSRPLGKLDRYVCHNPLYYL